MLATYRPSNTHCYYIQYLWCIHWAVLFRRQLHIVHCKKRKKRDSENARVLVGTVSFSSKRLLETGGEQNEIWQKQRHNMSFCLRVNSSLIYRQQPPVSEHVSEDPFQLWGLDWQDTRNVTRLEKEQCPFPWCTETDYHKKNPFKIQEKFNPSVNYDQDHIRLYMSWVSWFIKRWRKEDIFFSGSGNDGCYCNTTEESSCISFINKKFYTARSFQKHCAVPCKRQSQSEGSSRWWACSRGNTCVCNTCWCRFWNRAVCLPLYNIVQLQADQDMDIWSNAITSPEQVCSFCLSWVLWKQSRYAVTSQQRSAGAKLHWDDSWAACWKVVSVCT